MGIMSAGYRSGGPEGKGFFEHSIPSILAYLTGGAPQSPGMPSSVQELEPPFLLPRGGVAMRLVLCWGFDDESQRSMIQHS